MNMRSAGGVTWTPYAKQQRARAMYQRGQDFLLASILLRQRRGDGYAVLYLLCQSIEVALKALLLMRDYEKYKPRLRNFGHDISKLVEAARLEFGLKPPRSQLKGEVDNLNKLYSDSVHTFRYASFLDLMVDPSTIPYAVVARRLVAVLRLTHREFVRAQI